MNIAVERLLALFVTPPGGQVTVPAGHRDAPEATPRDGRVPSLLSASVDLDLGLGTCGLRVCVLGGERAGASLAWALAARLARSPPARCGSVCSAPPDPATESARPRGPSSPTTPTARRVARCLESAGHRASARGRVIHAWLPDAPDDARALLAAVDAQAPGAPIVTLLRGVRRPGFDALVAAQDLVLVVVAAEAPPSLSTLAVAELALVAPGARVRAVPLAARHGVPARRAAVGGALEALR